MASLYIAIRLYVDSKNMPTLLNLNVYIAHSARKILKLLKQQLGGEPKLCAFKIKHFTWGDASPGITIVYYYGNMSI